MDGTVPPAYGQPPESARGGRELVRLRPPCAGLGPSHPRPGGGHSPTIRKGDPMQVPIVRAWPNGRLVTRAIDTSNRIVGGGASVSQGLTTESTSRTCGDRTGPRVLHGAAPPLQCAPLAVEPWGRGLGRGHNGRRPGESRRQHQCTRGWTARVPRAVVF